MFEVTRGSVVNITTVPKDKNGDPVFPAVVTAWLNYVTLTSRNTVSVVLASAASGDPYEGNWDTGAVADMRPGIVYGSIECTGPHAADDFEFEVVANAANQGV